jgi:hypothetical protein
MSGKRLSGCRSHIVPISEVQMRHCKKIALACSAAGLLLSAAPVLAANGLVIEPRFFNDFSNSTETIAVDGGAATPTPTPTPAGDIHVAGVSHTVEINDSNMTRVQSGGANRDDVLISNDGGATPWVGSINNGFSISATFTLNDGTNSPRKETGVRINAPVTGDALFIINSDAGEVVAFGGGAPFHSFGSNGNGNGYTPGQTITLTETYVPGPGGTTNANPGMLDYTAQFQGGPLMDSGFLAWSNNEGGPGPNNFTIGAYDQTQSSSSADFIDDTIRINSAIVPEPTSLGLLGVGGIALLTRRRAKKA